jgi:hypothetical protein
MNIEDAIQLVKEHELSLNITFHPSGEESEFSAAIHELADALHMSAGDGISLTQGSGSDVPAVPALTFQHAAGGPIRYLALPVGQEQAPFIEMLTAGIPGNLHVSDNVKSGIRGVKSPVDITVFITSSCPNCPNAVRAANQLAVLSEMVTVTIIDVEVFPHLGERYKVRSVPMIVIDDELLINQVIPIQELADKILSRGADSFSEAAFFSLVNTGNIDRAANRLLEGGQADYFLSAWRKSSLSTRIALQMVATEAMEKDPAVLHGIVQELIVELNSKDDSLKGDTADLLGMIGHADAKEPLEALLQDDNPDIVEIAEDALDNLK